MFSMCSISARETAQLSDVNYRCFGVQLCGLATVINGGNNNNNIGSNKNISKYNNINWFSQGKVNARHKIIYINKLALNENQLSLIDAHRQTSD